MACLSAVNLPFLPSFRNEYKYANGLPTVHGHGCCNLSNILRLIHNSSLFFSVCMCSGINQFVFILIHSGAFRYAVLKIFKNFITNDHSVIKVFAVLSIDTGNMLL